MPNWKTFWESIWLYLENTAKKEYAYFIIQLNLKEVEIYANFSFFSLYLLFIYICLFVIYFR